MYNGSEIFLCSSHLDHRVSTLKKLAIDLYLSNSDILSGAVFPHRRLVTCSCPVETTNIACEPLTGQKCWNVMFPTS